MLRSLADRQRPTQLRLRNLMEPQSIAIVGAASDPRKLSGKPVRNLQRFGFAGDIYPVNPRHQMIDGLPCYASLADIGRPVDLVLVLTGAELAPRVVEEGVAAGAGSFIIYGSGFAEIGGDGLHRQQTILDRVQAGEAGLLGPNCTGLINSRAALCATFSTVIDQMEGDRFDQHGGTSFVGQSGAVASYWLDMALGAGLGFNKWISTGNEADISVVDAIDYLVADDTTDCICLYLEGTRDGPGLRRALVAAALANKPVLALRAGRSIAGAAAAASHTGAIAGESRIWEALFAQTGVIECDSLSEMISVQKLLRGGARTGGKRPVVMTISGGAGALTVDAAAQAGMTIGQPSEATAGRLADILPNHSQIANPIDFTGALANDPDLFRRCVEQLVASDEFDSFIIFLGLMGHAAAAIGDAIRDVLAPIGKPVVLIWSSASASTRAELAARRLVHFDDIPQAVQALAKLGRWIEARPNVRALTAAPDKPAARSFLSEHAGQQQLHDVEADFWPDGELIRTASDVASVAALWSSWPAVAKLQSGQLLHKTEHGAVILNISDAAALESATRRLFEIGDRLGIASEGVLVQEMVPHAHELLMGLRQDSLFGPILVLGRGGIEAETENDTIVRLLPLDAAAIEHMLRELRYSIRLLGTRGRPGVDLSAAAAKIAGLCEAYLSRPDIAELEINPLAVSAPDKIVALDLLMAVSGPAAEGALP